MTEFKASNGWYIDEYGLMREPGGYVVISPYGADNLRKFFQELRDHELGRWRDTENPDYVVYPKDRDFVVVVDESTGASVGLTRDDIDGFAVSTLCVQVAKRYFAAHPQHKPLPDAKGLYVNATDAREFLTEAAVLTRDYEGWHHYGDPRTDAESMAQKWHDAGELVRLVPEDGGDE